MVRLQKVMRKNRKSNEYLVSLSEAEVQALGWDKDEPLSKCVNKGRLVITSLKVEEKETGSGKQ